MHFLPWFSACGIGEHGVKKYDLGGNNRFNDRRSSYETCNNRRHELRMRICHVDSAGSGALHNMSDNSFAITIGFDDAARTGVAVNSEYKGQSVVTYNTSTATTQSRRRTIP